MSVKTLKKDEYIETTGRRKTSTARVRITESKKTDYTINGKPLTEYFATEDQIIKVESPMANVELPHGFSISVVVMGGGLTSQADAVRHGIARALIEYDPELRKQLKVLGFLKRDPRMKERRKFGLKKARKRAQWSKR